jgi:hypothetical protein
MDDRAKVLEGAKEEVVEMVTGRVSGLLASQEANLALIAEKGFGGIQESLAGGFNALKEAVVEVAAAAPDEPPAWVGTFAGRVEAAADSFRLAFLEGLGRVETSQQALEARLKEVAEAVASGNALLARLDALLDRSGSPQASSARAGSSASPRRKSPARPEVQPGPAARRRAGAAATKGPGSGGGTEPEVKG